MIQAGWAGLDAGGDDVITVGDVPHDWLFARAAAVVHHCGAGTTAAGLRAGVPIVAVPAGYGDQPFWARRLFELGVSPQPLRQSHLDPKILGVAIRTVLSTNRFRDNAEGIASQINTENGAGQVVSTVEKVLSYR